MKKIPTTIELKEKLDFDLRSSFGFQSSDYVEGLEAVTSVLAAQLKKLYLYAADNKNNLFPDTADLSEDGGELERLGLIYLNRQPRLATQGVYKLQLSGTIGAILRDSLTFKSSEESLSPGNLYILDESYTLTGVDDFVEVRSLGLGLDFKLKLGDKLNVTEPVIGLQSEATVSEIIIEPVTNESIYIYRQNIEDAIQLEAQGGAKTDYLLWSADAQGVRKVYVYLKDGEAGTVQVFVEATLENSTDEKGTPSTAMLLAVEQVFNFDPDETIPENFRGRRPIQANLEVLPITLVPVDITLIGITDSSLPVQNAIRNNISSYLYNIRPFIAGGQLLRKKSDILLNAKLSSIVSDVIGNSNYFTDFKMFVDGNEETIFTFSGSNIPYFRDLNL